MQLDQASADSFFGKDYLEELELQAIDNINVLLTMNL